MGTDDDATDDGRSAVVGRTTTEAKQKDGDNSSSIMSGCQQADSPVAGDDGWGKGNIEGITGGVATAEGGKIYIIIYVSCVNQS